MKAPALLTLGLLVTVAARADQAYLVGEENYGSGINTLQGCAADVTDMTLSLKSYGFNCDPENDQSRDQILAKLDYYAKTIKPKEPFVFYYSGHGRRNPQGLVPVNADQDDPNKDISLLDLKVKIQAIQQQSGGSVTVILDSCFSAGMIPKGALPQGVLSKGMTDDFLNKGPVSGSEAIAIDANERASNVCYVLATEPNEEALIVPMANGSRSIFTYFLADDLRKMAPTQNRETWERVRMEVAEKIASDLQDLPQHPVVWPPDYELKRVFTDEAGGELVTPDTLTDVIEMNLPEEKVFTFSVAQEHRRVEVGEPVPFQMSNGKEGALVIVGQGAAGDYYCMYPVSDDKSSLHFYSGSTDLDLSGKSFCCDTPGEERIKGVFFYDSDCDAEGEAVMDAFGLGHLGGELDLKGLSSDLKGKFGNQFATADVNISVGGDLVGGAQLKPNSAGGLLSDIQHKTSTTAAAIYDQIQKMASTASGHMKAKLMRLLKEQYPFPYEVAYICNLAICSGQKLDMTAGAGSKDDEATRQANEDAVLKAFSQYLIPPTNGGKP